jgi:hypothetical protein
VLAGSLLIFFLRLTFQHGWGFGVGPDVPVYLWWARVGASEGISLVGERPGIPALIATLAGTLHLPLVAVVAGLQYALATMVGVVAVALVRGRALGGRWAWLLAGLLAGLFAVHLGGGYVSNLAFTVPFFAAGASLATRSPRGTVAAALLLGGGGLAHPQFFALGVGVLIVAAVWAWVRTSDHGWASDAGRVTAAVAGGAAVVGAGMLSTAIGPARLAVDTSKDAFLRRVGLGTTLHDTYLSRFREKVSTYAPWILLPLALLGTARTRGFTRRFLISWAAVTVLAVPAGIVTGWFPPDRVVTFAFALPVLAALGVVWLWEVIARRSTWLAWPVAVGLVAVMGWAAFGFWSEQQTFISPEDMASATTAGRIAATLPAGTPLVFIVNDNDTTAIFQATYAANVIRAAIPPERAQDVHLYVGDTDRYFAHQPTVRHDPVYDTLSRTSLAEIPARPAAVFVIHEFNTAPAAREDPHLVRWDSEVSSTVPGPRPLHAGSGELHASNPWQIAGSSLAILLLLWAIGYGWARWAFADAGAAVAAAPGFGVAALIVVALILERVGIPFTGSGGPTAASALAGGLGYLLLVLKGKAVGQPPSEVHEHP